jgi:RNA-directed DNA polymerase
MPIVKFSELQTPEHLSQQWGVAVEDLESIANTTDLSGRYTQMHLPKRGRTNRGKFRTVYKVEWGVLSQLQKNISRDIDESVSFPGHVQGFVRKRSTVWNATIHIGQRVIVHADIENFFDSIDIGQVRKAFIRLGCPETTASLLAKICTLKGILPQGASTSPIVSNLVCQDLDTDLSGFAIREGIRYSRYGDDMTFSGGFPADISAIRRIVEQHRFKLQESKTRRQWRGKSQYVTGLSVSDGTGPRVPAKAKRRLRLELYYAKKYGIESHRKRVGCGWTDWRLIAYWRGWIDYLNSVPGEQALAKKLLTELESLQN